MNKNNFAPLPPMGWNSYDYYDTTVTENAVKANADYMAAHLKEFGWEYIIVDIEWYAIGAGSMRDQFQYIPFADVAMDEFSRLQPDPARFPSSADGTGFTHLADYIHSLGLKFGIHIMRGIPRTAAHNHCKIKGSNVTADMVANPSSICGWNPDMYGVRDTEAGQAYYDSLMELYASWGVDFIKCDDICNTNIYPANPYSARHEIEMLAKAIARCGRPIVLSLSPGPALIEHAWHYETYANMWRITDDFWDKWDLLKDMFHRCELWQNHVAKGCYPDCDMLPLGWLGKGFGHEWYTNFTPEEQHTMLTLWCLFGSPLMLGPARELLADGGEMVCLIKPQFEAGREKVGKKGVVRDKSVHEEVIDKVVSFALSIGFSVLHLEYSPIKGPEGNIEYLVHLKKEAEAEQAGVEESVDVQKVVDAAHGELDK
jgi:hypothetical protein